MKSIRQLTILELIESQNIETQEQLADALLSRGIRATQATVSRDIKELRLLKALTPEGTYKYATAEHAEQRLNERFSRILSDSILSVAASLNTIVVHTISGSANAACEAIDSMRWPEVLGTIAGDNTIFVVIRSVEEVNDVQDRLRGLMK